MLTPPAAAGDIGTLANATVSAHLEAGPVNQYGGYEHPLVPATTAAGLAARGREGCRPTRRSDSA